MLLLRYMPFHIVSSARFYRKIYATQCTKCVKFTLTRFSNALPFIMKACEILLFLVVRHLHCFAIVYVTYEPTRLPATYLVHYTVLTVARATKTMDWIDRNRYLLFVAGDFFAFARGREIAWNCGSLQQKTGELASLHTWYSKCWNAKKDFFLTSSLRYSMRVLSSTSAASFCLNFLSIIHRRLIKKKSSSVSDISERL